jgi:hypothetical protein
MTVRQLVMLLTSASLVAYGFPAVSNLNAADVSTADVSAASITAAVAQPPLVAFKDAAPSDLLVGSAYNDFRVWEADAAAQAAYDASFFANFELVTPENACKMTTIKPSKDGPSNFEPCERVLDLAEARGLPIRFHTLAWGSSTSPPYSARYRDRGVPEWVLGLTDEEKPRVLTEYVTEVSAPVRAPCDSSVEYVSSLQRPGARAHALILSWDALRVDALAR